MTSHAETQTCRRCGTCCQKGGPALHLVDKALVDDGIIPAGCLYTLRRGELAEDTLNGGLVALTAEMIKLKGMRKTWTCLFFDAAGECCRIYDNRPLECRLLKCWDTRDLERVYNDRRLARRDLLEGFAGVWDLVSDHETRCSYATLKKWVRKLQQGDRAALGMIVEMVRYDTEIRKLVSEKAGLDPGLNEFLLGRPFTETIKMFGLQIVEADGKYNVTKKGTDYTSSRGTNKARA